jgi:mercuric ion transport protein
VVPRNRTREKRILWTATVLALVRSFNYWSMVNTPGGISRLYGFERHADTLGAGGSLFAALCCLGTPAILAFLAAIGAGFLVNDLILLPLLAVSLLVSLWGLGKGRDVHGDRRPLALGSPGAVLIPAGIFVGAPLVAVGAILLIAATVWNVVARRQCEIACAKRDIEPQASDRA